MDTRYRFEPVLVVFCPGCGGRGRVRSTNLRKRYCVCKTCKRTFTVVVPRAVYTRINLHFAHLCQTCIPASHYGESESERKRGGSSR
jgi:hypothetical protein